MPQQRAAGRVLWIRTRIAALAPGRAGGMVPSAVTSLAGNRPLDTGRGADGCWPQLTRRLPGRPAERWEPGPAVFAFASGRARHQPFVTKLPPSGEMMTVAATFGLFPLTDATQ
jgi:hypothetical protein